MAVGSDCSDKITRRMCRKRKKQGSAKHFSALGEETSFKLQVPPAD